MDFSFESQPMLTISNYDPKSMSHVQMSIQSAKLSCGARDAGKVMIEDSSRTY